MMKVSLLISALALAGLSGCSDPADAVLFDGMAFKHSIKIDKEDRRRFVATSAPVSQSLDGAREAARFEGTAYCVRKYGSSEIEWSASPDAETKSLSIVEDQLSVQGRCAE